MSQNPQAQLSQEGEAIQENSGQQLVLGDETVADIRNFRPRTVYTQADREKAIKMLDDGVPASQVAKAIGPRCTQNTVHLWRKSKRKHDESIRLMEAVLKRPKNLTPEIRRALGIPLINYALYHVYR